MQLTRAADYAVRMMIQFASAPAGTRLTREALAEATGLPESFLGKILQSLTRAGLVRSRRGTDGGFVLVADARKLTLVEIIEAVDGPIALNLCLMNGRRCDQQDWCGGHRLWARAQAAMVNVLRSQSLAELAAETAAAKQFLQSRRSERRGEMAFEEVGNV